MKQYGLFKTIFGLIGTQAEQNQQLDVNIAEKKNKMNDLTEQWKKGELPSGWYYVKVIPDFEYPNDIAFYTGGYFELYSDDDIEQVLSPVPSYEEWEQLQNWADFTSDYHGLREKLEITDYDNTELKERLKKTQELELEVRRENAKLKELLKRVVNATDFYHKIKTASVVDYGVWYNIANEINQALGEDK